MYKKIYVLALLCIAHSFYCMDDTFELRHKIHQACVNNDVENVKQLIIHPQIHKAINYSFYKTSPLYEACWNDNIEIVSLLLTIPCIIVNPHHMNGHSAPLYITNNNDIAKLLIKHGADINCAGKTESPLLSHIKRHNFEIVKTILNAHPSGTQLHSGKQSLEAALSLDNFDQSCDIVLRLLKAGVTPTGFSPYKRLLKQSRTKQMPILNLACAHNMTAVVKLLLVMHNNDINPIDVNAAHPPIKIGAILSETPLQKACKQSNEYLVALLLQFNTIDVNKHTHDQPAPLAIAYRNRDKNKNIITLLLQCPYIFTDFEQ